jgi:hypothetical protein
VPACLSVPQAQETHLSSQAMTASATLVFGNHRPETLPLAQPLMAVHDIVMLEEPRDERFETMLDGRLSIEAYLLEQDLEYPEFSRQMAGLLRKRYRCGARLLQVEPFIETLLAIHDRFAAGQGPRDLPADTDLQRVYLAEHRATRELLAFYKASASTDFDAIVEAVKRFARADARRFALRDSMRAEAIAALLPESGSTYIEAGPMHYPLWRALRKRLPAGYPLRVHFLMTGVVRRFGTRRHLFGPGDLLTLLYRFHPRRRFRRENLLAARALIYNKLILKEEIVADDDSYPHTRDELEAGKLTDRLTVEDCRRLYPLVRRATTTTSGKIVAHYLATR